MNRVAIIYRMDHPGGVQSCVLALIRGLNARGIVPAIVWDVEPNRKLMKEHSAEASFLKVRFPVATRWTDKMPGSIRYILRSLNVFNSKTLGEKFDFIFSFYNGFLPTKGEPHVYFCSGPPILPQLVSRRSGLQALPTLFSRSLYRNLLRHRFPAYERHRHGVYVINSQFTARFYAETYGESIDVVYPPISQKDVCYLPGDMRERNLITFFSRIAPYKRPEFLIEVARARPDREVVIMGAVSRTQKKYLQKLEKQAEGLGNIRFVPNASQAIVHEILSKTRFYIFPARNEHFGMTTPEAICRGAVPFVHDSGGQREIVPQESLRFIDSNFDTGLARLLELPDETLNEYRMELSKHMTNFTEETFVTKMLNKLDAVS